MLARYSESPYQLTRRFASTAMQQVNGIVAQWMRSAGMTVRTDAVGNLIGRYEGTHSGARTLLLGSHLDTVIDAGKYDGIFGVLAALACVERLQQEQRRLPFAIEILAFADEEGLRYNYAYIGSKAVAGTFDCRALTLTDANNLTMSEAICAFGGDPAILRQGRPYWSPADLIGYYELHIEQGPVLEVLDLPVAIVSAISGQSRLRLEFLGQAGHAGTVPMSLRSDALCAAAEFILAVEAIASAESGLVATVGKLTVQPGAPNVIPGQVTLSLDVRHQEDRIREQACRDLHILALELAEQRNVSLVWEEIQASRTVPCSPRLIDQLQKALVNVNQTIQFLPSGAGHDAVAMSDLTEVAMLFLRCRGGISHHPDEMIKQADVEIALEVTEQFLSLLAEQEECR
ncbi:Zn-dependent hydrolase [Tengunoibacter tsumagoiensis]|uniref:Zn-dependent hydrolase n=2 Tax=Tengunoibacter tsumagoiensis TaxID=2014871 RepID=A0A402A196_9CHLR|nr:Zn-dependent hydrolase [Tengunoibacter tsumagoiensis]